MPNYYTTNMVQAFKDVKVKWPQATFVDQVQPWMPNGGQYVFLDPPRKHQMTYHLYGNAELHTDMKKRRFKLLNPDGNGALLRYPPFAHDSISFVGPQGWLYERKQVYKVGAAVKLAVYQVTLFAGGSTLSGSVASAHDGNQACDIITITQDQKMAICKSLLTYKDRLEAISRGEDLENARAFVYACMTDKTSINAEELDIMMIREAQQVLNHTRDVKSPMTRSQKANYHLKKYSRKGAVVKVLRDRMAWLRSNDLRELDEYIAGDFLTPLFFGMLAAVIASGFTCLLLPSWILAIGWLILSLCTYAKYQADMDVSRWIPKLRGWRKTHGCDMCKSRVINCRWCDHTQNFTVGRVHNEVMNIDQARQLSKQGDLHCMTLDDRLSGADLSMSYLNNLTKINTFGRPLQDIIEEANKQPYRATPTYFSTLLPAPYRKHVFNSIVSSDTNLLTALFTRQAHYDTRPDENYLKSINFGVIDMDVYEEAVMLAPIQFSDEFLLDVLPSKKKLYDASIKSFQINPNLKNSYRAFSKRGENGVNRLADRKARLICGPNKAMVGVGAWLGRNEMSVMKVYWRRLFRNSPKFSMWTEARKDLEALIQGMNGDQVRANIEDAMNTFDDPVEVSLDVKNFDASQHRLLMEMIDFAYRKMNRPLYARLGLNRHQIDGFMKFAQTTRATIEIFKSNQNPKVKIRRDKDHVKLLQVVADHTTFSGDPLKTTLGNTNRQLHLIYCMAIAAGLIQDIFAMASGDDMLVIVERARLAEFQAVFDKLYCVPGDTGVKGCGLILKEILVSDTNAKFLSKNIVIKTEGTYKKVFYYRQVDRLLRTGEFSENVGRKDISEEQFNYCIQKQLEEQVSGDPVLEKVLEWRKKRLPMKTATKKVLSKINDTYEAHMKQQSHAVHMSEDMYYCGTVDSDYQLLAAGATPEEILVK